MKGSLSLLAVVSLFTGACAGVTNKGGAIPGDTPSGQSALMRGMYGYLASWMIGWSGDPAWMWRAWMSTRRMRLPTSWNFNA
jgi:hypothetical protein